jgi:sugar phosphate isomerase/epimerase
MTGRVLASTTSHKRESLPRTLEVFSRLGFCDVDLNLHPLLEGGVPIDLVCGALQAGRQRVPIVSGGWCDFFHVQPDVEATFRSVEGQVAMADRLRAKTIRLFFGRLPADDYRPGARDAIAGNLRRLSIAFPTICFVFENHDGASLVPEICRDILARVDRSNIRLNFDPINFERVGVGALDALRVLQPFIAHVHLKGLAGGGLSAFGTGDVDLTPVLRQLLGNGYRGDFTVEYEGPGDGTVQMYESICRARDVIAALDTANDST